MAVVRNWRAAGYVFTAPYFDELLGRNGGCLPQDISAHALWHYYCIAWAAWEREKSQVVYEGEADAVFRAKDVFLGVAKLHGVSPDGMLSYWPAVKAQAKLLGSEPDRLPARFRFEGRSG